MVQSQIVQSITKKYNNASLQIRVLITQQNLSSLLTKNDLANSLFTPNSGIIFYQNTNKIRDSPENHFLEIEGGFAPWGTPYLKRSIGLGIGKKR